MSLKGPLIVAGCIALLVATASVASAQDAALLKKAKAGDAGAQYNLGVMYDEGEGTARDYAEAVKWYRKSAEQGHAPAQHNLGVMYREGEGITEDDAEAVKWIRKAAEQGNARAQNNLGVMYASGEGVAQDYVLAHMWWSLAQAQGEEAALGNLEVLVQRMTKEQIVEAQKMAREWQELHRASGGE